MSTLSVWEAFDVLNVNIMYHGVGPDNLHYENKMFLKHTRICSVLVHYVSIVATSKLLTVKINNNKRIHT